MALQVSSMDLMPLDNAKSHHTERFELLYLEDEPPCAVIRRGQPFKLTITFKNRPYDEAVDKVRIVFNYGTATESLRGSRGGAWLTGANQHSENMDLWSLRKISSSDKTLLLEMRCSVLAGFGEYYLSVKTSLRSSAEIVNYSHPQPVYILLNPWCKDDAVYMPKQRLLDEYIINDVGKIWYGRYERLIHCKGREWVFGQFDKDVLRAAVKIINETALRYEHRGNPVFLARAISKLINDADDNGVLVGNWSGNYEDGVSPSMWTGSVPILKQYLEQGPVKYGQCWVFSGVTTTVCRAIGIPARSVSNIVSAHDGDASLTFDQYFDEDNEIEDSDDSIWNFHVWNDVWMARSDLPPGYGGWQAIDATPQETSDGVYQCGPASLEAVKRGSIGMKYDVPFIIASVNADVLTWKVDPGSLLGYKRVNTNEYHVGRIILTKQPFIFDPHGDADREDITHHYKCPEGSSEERLSYYKAVKASEMASAMLDMPEESEHDVLFSLNDIETVDIGQTFTAILQVENVFHEPRTIQFTLYAKSIYYNGVKANAVKKRNGKFKIKPKSKETIKLQVTVDEYLDKLVEFGFLKILAIATVLETKQTWAAEDDFQFIKPPLQVIVNKNLDSGLANKIGFKFKNPLKRKLTNCKLVLEASGLIKYTKMPFRDILPEEEVVIEYQITPKVQGDFILVAIFYTKELSDITGSEKFSVV